MRTDAELLALYRAWSEDFYAASFLTPSPGTVASFRGWLKAQDREHKPLDEYEKRFLWQYHSQEDYAQRPTERLLREEP